MVTWFDRLRWARGEGALLATLPLKTRWRVLGQRGLRRPDLRYGLVRQGDSANAELPHPAHGQLQRHHHSAGAIALSNSLRRPSSPLAWAFVLWVFSLCALRTRSTWLEYYGAGPPYFGRTTNMDKWESPVADLIVSNGLGLVLIASVFYGVRRLGARQDVTPK